MTRTTYIEDLGEGKIGNTKTREKRAVSNTRQGSANAFDPQKADRDKDGQVSDYEKTVAMKMLANMRKNA